MRLDNLDRKRSPAVQGPYTDEGAHGDVEDAEPRRSDAFEVPRVGYGAQNPREQGYTVPDAQFDYDTTYQGGHEERVFGSK